MEMFDALIWVRDRAKVEFDNGYCASVLRGELGFTKNGTYELAVLKDGRVCYETPVTNSVLGYLDAIEVDAALLKVSELKPIGGLK